MRVGIGQINSSIGAIEANADAIIERIGEARAAGCDLVVFPEMAVPGYAPLDLIWRPGFVDACEATVDRIRASSGGIGVLVGSIIAKPRQEAINRFDLSSLSDGAQVDLFNVAVLIDDANVLARAAKMHLPCYDVYDEKRYLEPSPGIEVTAFRGLTLGLNVCEDLWVSEGPTELQASLGADWIVNLSASPFYVGKPAIRRRLVSRRARENGVGIVYVNRIGGQDDVVYDGGSMVADAEGRFLFQAPHFGEGLYVVDLDHAPPVPESIDDDVAQIRAALTLGIRDYVRKSGFSSVLLGLSGGIDSALVCTLAAEALGPEAVTAVYLPSRFSSDASGEDARALAERLGVEYLEISIDEVHRALRGALPEKAEGLVDENLQPRARGALLMAIANARGALVLCPGNKAEIALGYNTLYGDTVGALAPISDLYKSDVYRLARSFGDRIPARILDKPPSAELRPDQRDDDDMPPYALLDPILRELIERNASRAQLIDRGFDEAAVDEALRRYYTSEYKRQQLPPGIKVTPKAFGIGRRVPITHSYRD